ncbi:MAG TPA: CGNR zinc finger domain-containing protein, partial [Steroidobacteraceae bacterium]|nr:CGNR zinc finger domain-containing protein [Steroidobacteraceae bacterium]
QSPPSMSATAAPFLFVAGQPAIDFLNTAYAPDGELVETLVDGGALLDWMVRAGLLEEREAAALSRRFSRKALDAAAQEARAVREWARTWLAAWRSNPTRDFSEETVVLNKLLARATGSHELTATRKRFELLERPRYAEADALVARIALEIAHLVVQEDPTLLKACAGADCTLWFLDRTKAHRRMFCSATACGNRAKVAAFRRRAQRATTE